MLDEKKFNKALIYLAAAKQIDLNQPLHNIWYQQMKNDFNDEEFALICSDVLKNVEFFGKYPDIKHFYDRKQKETPKDRQVEDCSKFLAKVEDYITTGFICQSQREGFANNLTDSERKALNGVGGISALWTAHNRDDYPRSVDAILKELRQRFDEVYTPTTGNLLLTNNGNKEQAQKLEDMTKLAIKRIC